MARSKRVQSKCFSGILRRMLCTGSLPTHPSDQITESNSSAGEQLAAEKDSNAGEARGKPEAQKAAEEARTTATVMPGIVARLMGLDSMPDFNLMWDPKRGSLTDSSLGRSRSMNSLEYLLHFERMQASESFRARTSSFREVPTFLHPKKDQDFRALCSGNEAEKKGLNRQRKTETSSVELKRKPERRNRGEAELRIEKNSEDKMKRVSKGRNQAHVRKVSGKFQSRAMGNRNGLPQNRRNIGGTPCTISKGRHPIRPIRQKEPSAKPKTETKKKKDNSAAKVVPECNSDCLSSFSYQSPSSEEKGPKELNLSMRKKKPSSAKLIKSEHPFPNRICILSDDEECEPAGEIKNRGDGERIRVSYPGLEATYYVEMLGRIGQLTEEDVRRAKWADRQQFLGVGFEDYEEMCREFGEQIVEQLVCQVVDELLGISHGKFAL